MWHHVDNEVFIYTGSCLCPTICHFLYGVLGPISHSNLSTSQCWCSLCLLTSDIMFDPTLDLTHVLAVFSMLKLVVAVTAVLLALTDEQPVIPEDVIQEMVL